MGFWRGRGGGRVGCKRGGWERGVEERGGGRGWERGVRERWREDVGERGVERGGGGLEGVGWEKGGEREMLSH